MKLDPNDTTGRTPGYWVAHPDSRNAFVAPSPEEEELINRRYEIDILAVIDDSQYDYEYDEFAFCKLDNDYYLFNNPCCRCPSPTETWRVAIGPATAREIFDSMADGKYRGGMIPVAQLLRFYLIIWDHIT